MAWHALPSGALEGIALCLIPALELSACSREVHAALQSKRQLFKDVWLNTRPWPSDRLSSTESDGEQSPCADTDATEDMPSPTPSQIEAWWEGRSGDEVQSPSSPPFDASMIAIRKAQCERERQRDRDSESDEALLKLESPTRWLGPEQRQLAVDSETDAGQSEPAATRKRLLE